MSTSYKVATRQDIEPGSAKCVEAAGRYIALFNVDGAFYATDDECTHAEASLSDGWLEENEVTCPLHGAVFDVTTGKPLSLPATRPVRTYLVRVEGNDIYVEV
ncbi:MAG TPA: bifunctional 3-phenylpropionate/cinnamic acid dioxygenase ferredoxin subunit [Chloroflexota bacterium]|nr:bifunctional 3-phenylpropionate/cinnamic acid dioxygenase ferredoxin subunit [Chloroflexota bacterium]